MRRWRNRAGDAPSLAWGDALRADKARLSRLRRRIALTAAGVGFVLASAAIQPAPRLVWNSTASAPIGLYVVTPGVSAESGDMVVARLPERFRRLAAERHYLPANVPLVKRVAASAGDEVCALGEEILVNGERVAVRRRADGRGRAMPAWGGCLRLRGRQLFLLTDAPASFDGRYFGVTDGAEVIGRAWLLWRR